MGADDSGWRPPVNNLEVMSFIELYMVLIFTTGPDLNKKKIKTYAYLSLCDY